ncbi:MAG TPA: hypothetical protein G4O16_10535 [Dehalococcoidia bacterium]|nr:hypothetical protein [Dehalococcoidia bacterium]
MSRLVDKLTRTATRNASQPMGFRTARADRDQPKMLVIARVKMDNTGQIADYVTGADGVWLHSARARLTPKAMQPVTESISDIPCGVSLEDAGTGNNKALKKVGCDFLVLTDSSPVDAMPKEEDDIGTILGIEPSLEDSLIRVINNLPVDAVLTNVIKKASTTLAWHDLMSLQRLGLLLTKPLLVQVSPGISSSELKAIHEADVDGIVVEANPVKPDYFKEMRKTISELPPHTTRKRAKSEALLPFTGSPQPAATPDEDDGDYE